MKIKTITYTERRVLAQYEYAELTSTAELSDGDNEAEAVIILLNYVQSALKMEMKSFKENENGKVSGECNDSSSNDGGNSQEEQIKKEDKADKKAKKRPKKEGTPPSDQSDSKPKHIEPEEAVQPVGKNVVAYDSTISEHKSIFAGYLTKKYENAWKTVKPAEEIKAFTASLNGKDFLDKEGKIVDDFISLVHEFFGA